MKHSSSSTPPSTLRIDFRKGSRDLSLYPPLRDLLPPCLHCRGEIGSTWRLNSSTFTYYKEIDKRTRKEKPPSCRHCYDTGRVLSSLSSGDVSFIGDGKYGPITVGIEVKSISDLISSISTGRLQDTQVSGMINDYDEEGRWILHYGLYRPSPKDNTIQIWREGSSKRREGWYTLALGNRVVPYSYLESFKVSTILEYGFHLIRVNDIIEAAQWLGVLHKTWTKPYHTHKSMRTVDRSQDVEEMMRRERDKERQDGRTKTDNGFVQASIPIDDHGNGHNPKFMDRLRVAHTFPSLGFEKAKAAANWFSSIREMVNAEVDEWKEVEVEVGKGRKVRIGKTIAKRIDEFLS